MKVEMWLMKYFLMKLAAFYLYIDKSECNMVVDFKLS